MGWYYKVKRNLLRPRDRALICILYLCAQGTSSISSSGIPGKRINKPRTKTVRLQSPDQSQAAFPWGYAIFWQDKERPITWQKGVEDPSDVAAGKGILLLTNKRLLFLTKFGLLSKYSIHDAFDLENIVSVSPYKMAGIGPFQNKYIRVTFANGSERDFSKMGIHGIVAQMNQAITVRKQQVLAEGPLSKEPSPIGLGAGQPSSVPSVILEKEIRVVVKVKCRYCGQLNDQLNSKCESCGAPLG